MLTIERADDIGCRVKQQHASIRTTLEVETKDSGSKHTKKQEVSSKSSEHTLQDVPVTSSNIEAAPKCLQLQEEHSFTRVFVIHGLKRVFGGTSLSRDLAILETSQHKHIHASELSKTLHLTLCNKIRSKDHRVGSMDRRVGSMKARFGSGI